MISTAIQIENLSKTYNLDAINIKTFKEFINSKFTGIASHEKERIRTVEALTDISLEVYQGESLGIIGKNGSGKSTLLKILSGISVPTSGKVTIYGRVGSVLDIGLGFHPELTGRENIMISGELLGMNRKEIRSRMDEIIAFSGVEKFIDTPVKYYSSGMYVRLAFSVVAHLSADILLFDEVMAVGDMQFQIKSYNKIQSLLQSGTTVLLVSHNLNDVQKFCSRALVLEKGRISKYGPTAEIISNYAENEISESQQNEQTSDNKPKETLRQEVIWNDIHTAPGDDRMRLHTVQLYPVGKSTDAPISVKDEVVIQVDYWKLKNEDIIDIGIIINHFNNIVFASSNRLSTSMENRVVKERGLYSAKAIIPANFLNSTVYSLDIYGFQNLNDVILKQPNIIFFKINDVIDEVLGELYKKMPVFPGSIRPQLAWTVEKME